jgi:hypothetical protein
MHLSIIIIIRSIISRNIQKSNATPLELGLYFIDYKIFKNCYNIKYIHMHINLHTHSGSSSIEGPVLYNLNKSIELPELSDHPPSIPKIPRGETREFGGEISISRSPSKLTSDTAHLDYSFEYADPVDVVDSKNNQVLFSRNNYPDVIDDEIQFIDPQEVSIPKISEVSGFSADVAWNPSFVLAPR